MNLKKLFIFSLILTSLNSFGQIGPSSGLSIVDNQSLYLIPTTIFSAINLTTTAITIHRLNNQDKTDKYRTNAIFAIISGGLQTAIGIGNISANYKNSFIPTSLNIGIGASTIVTSIIRLARKKKTKNTLESCNFLYSLTVDNSSIVGIRIIRKFN